MVITGVIRQALHLYVFVDDQVDSSGSHLAIEVTISDN